MAAHRIHHPLDRIIAKSLPTPPTGPDDFGWDADDADRAEAQMTGIAFGAANDLARAAQLAKAAGLEQLALVLDAANVDVLTALGVA